MPTAQQRALNKKLSQIFRMRGLTVRPDAMPLLYDFLETDEENWEAKLQALLAAVQREPLKDSAVDGAVIRKALGQVATQSARSTELPLEVIDAFAMTAVRYAAVRQAFLPAPAGSLHGPAESKQTMLALRLHLLEQRLKRNKLFKPPALSHGVASKEHIVLTHLDALLGRKGPRVVLGLLTEKEEGQYYLEDTHSSVPLDLSQAETQRGFFTRNACVLMEGEVQPPADTPSRTRTRTLSLTLPLSPPLSLTFTLTLTLTLTLTRCSRRATSSWRPSACLRTSRAPTRSRRSRGSTCSTRRSRAPRLAAWRASLPSPSLRRSTRSSSRRLTLTLALALTLTLTLTLTRWSSRRRTLTRTLSLALTLTLTRWSSRSRSPSNPHSDPRPHPTPEQDSSTLEP